jgi:hypothetical protein
MLRRDRLGFWPRLWNSNSEHKSAVDALSIGLDTIIAHGATVVRSTEKALVVAMSIIRRLSRRRFLSVSGIAAGGLTSTDLNRQELNRLYGSPSYPPR